MKSGKKVIRVALAILCMVSMLFISEYQKVQPQDMGSFS